jgi:hypothetical protein
MTEPGQIIVRYDHARNRHTAPAGTRKCISIINHPHPSDLVHELFAAEQLGTDRVIQLMTSCGKRAHRFVPESEGRAVDCPGCLMSGVPGVSASRLAESLTALSQAFRVPRAVFERNPGDPLARARDDGIRRWPS